MRHPLHRLLPRRRRARSPPVLRPGDSAAGADRPAHDRDRPGAGRQRPPPLQQAWSPDGKRLDLRLGCDNGKGGKDARGPLALDPATGRERDPGAARRTSGRGGRIRSRRLLLVPRRGTPCSSPPRAISTCCRSLRPRAGKLRRLTRTGGRGDRRPLLARRPPHRLRARPGPLVLDVAKRAGDPADQRRPGEHHAQRHRRLGLRRGDLGPRAAAPTGGARTAPTSPTTASTSARSASTRCSTTLRSTRRSPGRSTRRPAANNPQVRIGVADLATAKTTWMKTGDPDLLSGAASSWTPRRGRGRHPAPEPGPEPARPPALRRRRRRLRHPGHRAAGGPGSISAATSGSSPTAASSGAPSAAAGAGSTSMRADGTLVRPVTPEGVVDRPTLDAVAEDGSWALVTAFPTAELGAIDRKVAGAPRASETRTAGRCSRRSPAGTTALVSPRTGSWVHVWSDANTPPRTRCGSRHGAVVPFPRRRAQARPAALPQVGVPHHPRAGRLAPAGAPAQARRLRPRPALSGARSITTAVPARRWWTTTGAAGRSGTS